MSDEEKRPALHQILPAEKDLANRLKTAEKVATEKLGQFQRYVGATRTLKMFDKAREQEEMTDVQAMGATVSNDLRDYCSAFVRAADARLQKDRANQNACADIVVEEKLIASRVPATALLSLEERIKHVRSVYEKIPVLPTGHRWEPQDGGTWRVADTVEKIKAEKAMKPVVLHPATDRHPAQVEKITYDKPVGKYLEEKTVGMWSEAEKARVLARIDQLAIAIKQARHRANCADVVSCTIGDALVSYITG